MGSIFKDGSRWRGQTTVNGKRKSVSGKTKKEVEKKLAELQVKPVYERENITVQEWCEYWLETRKRPILTEQSFIRLESQFRNHVYPYVGKMKMNELTPFILEEMYAKVFQKKPTGKNYQIKTYSHATVNGLSVQFKKCLQFAVDREVISKNPHNGVELHKLRPPKKIEAYASADQKKIVDICKKGKEANQKLFYFLISTGMRFGEATALTWDDVDLDTGAVNITKTSVAIHGSMTIQKHPKTKAGVRTIYLAPTVLEWLKYHRSTLDEDANYRNLVFPNMRYNIINQQNAILAWKNFCIKNGLEYKGMHALRHTFATRALESGIDVKVVSSMLGHKNVITTMNIYQDVMADQKIKAICTMDALF
jgi:integrase